jgi:hypothetical protein
MSSSKLTRDVIGSTLAGKMSVIERVKQIQAEKQRKITEVVVASQKAQRESVAATETRKKFLESQREKLIEESGVYIMLQQIEKSFLENSNQNHRIFQQKSSDTDNVYWIWLAWGYERSQEFENGIYGGGYDSVDIKINLDTESINIGGNEIQGKLWQKDRNLIEKQIAETFLSPNENRQFSGSWADPGYGGGLS